MMIEHRMATRQRRIDGMPPIAVGVEILAGIR